jgi:Enoyl-CoA hydratase/carnithine racemase
MAYENILVETKGSVGIITLDRPEALNALNAALIEDLGQALDSFEADDNIGCIVLTGSSKAFAAGADISEMAPKSYMDVYREDFINRRLGTRQPDAQASYRRRGRLCPGRWL